MALALFVSGYLATLAVPSVLFLLPLGGIPDLYAVSVLAGVCAWAMLANQVFLASRPKAILALLGAKGLLKLHGVLALCALATACLHLALKGAVGFGFTGVQPLLGILSLAFYLSAALAAFLLMSPAFYPFSGRLRAFREYVYAHTPLSYVRSRAIHGLTAVVLFVLLVHILLASSASFAVNPAGSGFMIAWTLVSGGLYLRYRVRGRNTK